MHLSFIKQKLSTQHPGERKQLLEKNVILSFPRSEECGVDAPVQLRQQRGHEPDTQRAGIQSQRRSSAEPASLPEKKKKVNMWTHSELINDAHCSVLLWEHVGNIQFQFIKVLSQNDETSVLDVNKQSEVVSVYFNVIDCWNRQMNQYCRLFNNNPT